MTATRQMAAEMDVEQRLEEEEETIRRPSIEKKPVMLSSADAGTASGAFGKLPDEIIEQ